MSRRRILGAGAAAIAGTLLSAPWLRVRAEPQIGIAPAGVPPLRIAIPDFLAVNSQAAAMARDIAAIMRDDLRRGGSLALVDAAALPEKAINPDLVPRFAAWRSIDVRALVTGSVDLRADGWLKAGIRLWDVSAGLQLAGYIYSVRPDEWQVIAHVAAEAFYERLATHRFQ